MSDATAKARRKNLGPIAGPANRRAIVAAARELFAEAGLAVPFSAIARRAGVGQGSLYRHFPDLVALAAAVFEVNVGEIEAHTAPPERTLDDLFDIVVAQAVQSTALLDLTFSRRDDPAVVALGRRFEAVVARLVVRERARETLGPHVDATDIQLLTGMLAGELARTPTADRPAVATRIRALIARSLAP